MITPIDVVDSAVKIGLGAIISGLATYWLAKASHDKTIEKESAQRKRDMMEVAAQEVGRFDQSALRHWEAVYNWIDTTPADTPMSEGTREELGKLAREAKEGYRRVD